MSPVRRNGVRRETGRQRTRAEVPRVDLHDLRLDPLPWHTQNLRTENYKKEESNFLSNQKKPEEMENRWTT